MDKKKIRRGAITVRTDDFLPIVVRTRNIGPAVAKTTPLPLTRSGSARFIYGIQANFFNARLYLILVLNFYLTQSCTSFIHTHTHSSSSPLVSHRITFNHFFTLIFLFVLPRSIPFYYSV